MQTFTPELELLTREEAAARLGVTATTLARWAQRGRGPDYCRTGDTKGRVWYRPGDLAAWLESRRQSPRVCRGTVR